MLVFSVSFASHVVVSVSFSLHRSLSPLQIAIALLSIFDTFRKCIVQKAETGSLKIPFVKWRISVGLYAICNGLLFTFHWWGVADFYMLVGFFPCVISSVSVSYMNYRPIPCFATPKVFRLLPPFFSPVVRSVIRFLCEHFPAEQFMPICRISIQNWQFYTNYISPMFIMTNRLGLSIQP